ncbi:rho guanine nucleotide exchange factor 11-like isoform X2 [Ostrinia furnacalis]|uniref:rho guanine nucleotide exchange factor 11-like isoform X2 n=1 Tax=Ostrinia furnacalis TaxID=93504 RepID=UPI00104056A8|nr:rho guanine nucleotide exchange factor 11-like isoform X2 [Ostrinia furnacalis]
MATSVPPRVSRNVSLPAGRQPPTVAMLARRTLSESDLEPGAATAPSGSSSSSSLSSRSNESNTVAAEQQASQSDWSEEDEPLAAQWADSLPPHVLEALQLSSRLRKRQEVIHELIVSEGSHVRWLKVLCRVFLRPLEAAPSLLPADELRALFPNLPDVRDWHAALHARLRAARHNAPSHLVPLNALADAMLATLGEPSYAACLSRFCRGQRLALEALRERRRKNKELHQFLATREQLPLCGRLQLRDLLACVWQRLTKYRLLLESVLNTVCEEEDDPSDVVQLRRALDEAKYMLHSVDTSIRAAENEHRLRTIQSKLEVRVERGAGAEWDELKRLDLTQHRLRLEGDLSLRHESSKKTAMLALMFEEMLVLLQREGDKYVLRPIPQPSQHAALSPLIKWDKVLFRPNAAVRNTFFLMNINGVQMHELSANSNADYNTWVNYIQEAPLAKVELKQSVTPSHQASRSTDDSGINVSRNPSDASEKSNLTAEDTEPERDRCSLERAESDRDRASTERSVPDKDSTMEDKEKENQEKCDKEPEAVEREEKHVPRRPTVGRISTHASNTAPGLEPTGAITVRPPVAASAHTAETAYTYQERLRRLDEGIVAALAAKRALVGRALGVPAPAHAHLAELAVAEALGDLDINRELRATRQSSRESSDDDAPQEPDVMQLLLAAHEQATQLTEAISKALTVNEAAVVAARARRGRCNNCRGPVVSQQSVASQHATTPPVAPPASPAPQQAVASVASVVTPVASLVTPAVSRTSVADTPEFSRPLEDGDQSLDRQVASSLALLERSLSSDASYDMLRELDATAQPEPDAGDALESNASAALLAAKLTRLACGVQSSLSGLILALPHDAPPRAALRAQLAAATERAHRLHAALASQAPNDYQMTDEYFIKPEGELPIQDQPSNGG